MTTEVQSTRLAAPSASLVYELGEFLDGRFALEDLLFDNSLYCAYRAEDAEAQASVLVLGLRVGSDPSALEAASALTALEHKNLARLVAVGAHGGHPYLVYEYHDGHTLAQLLERKKATGAGAFNLKGALNIIAHAAAGLSALHPQGGHGLVGLDTTLVNKAGRVVMLGVGLSPFLPRAAADKVLPGWPSLAPEVSRGGAATPAADVYSLTALAYYALVGADPVKGCKRPSEVVPGLPPAVDALVGRGMTQDPTQRFPSTTEVAAALKTAAVTAVRPAQSAPAASGGEAPGAPRAPGGRPSLAQEIISVDFDDDDDGAPAQEPLNVSAALQAALADTDERFLINMGNLDYGPFSLQEVVDKITSGEIVHGHQIIDKDTGNRQNVEEQPLLADLVEQAKQRRDEERRASAEVAHASQEKRRGIALYAFIALGVIGLGGGAYALVSALSADDGDDGPAEVAALDQGDLQVKITPIKRSKPSGRRGKRRSNGGGGGGVAGGWDDSLNMDMSEGGGSERLDDSQINPVIQKHGGRLGGCLSRTGSRFADIEFIIAGTGKVKYVRVNGETGGALAKCVRAAMMRMKFPSFNGPRTKANFNMSL